MAVKAKMTPEEKEVFRARRDELLPYLPDWPVMAVKRFAPGINPKHAYNVLRTDIKRYDLKILGLFELVRLSTPNPKFGRQRGKRTV